MLLLLFVDFPAAIPARYTGSYTVPKYVPMPQAAPARPRAVGEAVKGKRRVHFDARTALEAVVYERDRLDIGVSISGPAIVEQFDATTVLPPGWRGHVDTLGNLVLDR